MFLLYIDPGSGFIIIQLIIAAFASVALFFKKIKERIKSLFRRRGDKN